jgi:hypothetical protein
MGAPPMPPRRPAGRTRPPARSLGTGGLPPTVLRRAVPPTESRALARGAR